MAAKKGKLTERQKRFADYYLQLGNASEAAERAGFNRSYAQAAKRQPAVQAYMKERLQMMNESREEMVREVLSILTGAMRGEYEGELPDRDSSPMVWGAEMLAKRLGIYDAEIRRSLREGNEAELAAIRERYNWQPAFHPSPSRSAKNPG